MAGVDAQAASETWQMKEQSAVSEGKLGDEEVPRKGNGGSVDGPV
jgi:hypothetical protein